MAPELTPNIDLTVQDAGLAAEAAKARTAADAVLSELRPHLVFLSREDIKAIRDQHPGIKRAYEDAVKLVEVFDGRT